MRIYLLLIVAMMMGHLATAQGQKRRKPPQRPNANEQFLQTQFWIGFKGGVNLTKATPDLGYSTFSAIDFSETVLEKEYDDFSDLGSQFGLEFILYHKGFSISIYPNYTRMNFTYSNGYEYSGADPNSLLTLDYTQKQKLEYLDFPLVLKYDILQEKIRPFVQVGAYYGMLLNANKEIEISGTDFASGAEDPFTRPSIIVGAEDIFIKSNVGLIGGIGVNYDEWNVRFMFDVSYRYGLNNITDKANRFSENRLAGAGDALDDISLDNISINMGVLFPLRFISKDYSSGL